jgi:transposase InsO family protein
MSVRWLIATVELEGLNVSEFCRAHGVSRDRFYEIRRRFEAEGEAGLEPRSRAPRVVANKTPGWLEDLIVGIRKELVDAGWEAGPAMISFQLGRRGVRAPSDSTIWRVLSRRGFVVPDPSKSHRPLRRFAAERANECWQIDDTGWWLADRTEVKIIDVVDDCTRLGTRSLVVPVCTQAAAWDALVEGAALWGWPQRVLSDNGSPLKALRPNLGALGIELVHSRPFHPQTCGKVERFHQSLKDHLVTRPRAASIAELQAQVDAWLDYYNHDRPHRSLHKATPADIWAQTPKSGPAGRPLGTPTRIGRCVIDRRGVANTGGTQIAVGATHIGQPALTIITGDHAHVFIDGQLVRELDIDRRRVYQPLKTRPSRKPAPQTPSRPPKTAPTHHGA